MVESGRWWGEETHYNSNNNNNNKAMAAKVDVGEFTSPNQTHAPLRLLVASILRSREHYSHLYSFDDISAVLAVAINNDTLEPPCKVDADLLQEAFTNGGIKKYTFNISMFPEYKDDDSVLIVSLSIRVGSARSGRRMTTATIGCFPTRNDAILAEDVTPWDVGSCVAELVQHDIGLSNDDKGLLIEFGTENAKPKEIKSKRRKKSPAVVKQEAIEKQQTIICNAEEDIVAAQQKIIASKEEIVRLKEC